MNKASIDGVNLYHEVYGYDLDPVLLWMALDDVLDAGSAEIPQGNQEAGNYSDDASNEADSSNYKPPSCSGSSDSGDSGSSCGGGGDGGGGD